MKRAGILIGLFWMGLAGLNWPATAQAQWNVSLATQQSYNDNPFSYRTSTQSWISTYSLGIQRTFPRLAISYYGDLSRFSAIPDRNYYWHQLALWRESQTWRWGAYVNQQINRTAYNLYDYLTATLYARKQGMARGIYWTANAALSRNHYAQLSDLDNWQWTVSLNLNRSLPSRTTIIAGARYRYKQYVQSTTLPGGRVMPGWEHGHGDSNRGGMGWFTGMNDGHMGGSSYAPSLSQAVFWLRLAQSLTPTTGAALQYTQQVNLTGTDRFITGIELLDAQESQLFDDPMGYEGYALTAQLTQLLPGRMMFRAGAVWKYKSYISQGIYTDSETFDENTLREDTYRSIWIYLQKTIAFSSAALPRLNAYIQLQWTNNTSNSYWYDYRSQLFSIGLELDL